MKAEDWRIICFDELASTNDTALEYSQKVHGDSLVIKAERQTAGRGRRGRSWVGLDGNLFFSLLLEFDIKNLGALVVICALSLLQSIKRLKPKADVLLKWQNDVLLNGRKVSGILLEKGAGKYMVAGIGVNVKQSPETANMLYPVISLKQAGIDVSADELLKLYLKIFCDNINLFNEKGFDILRRRWLENAKGVGKRITVRQNDNTDEGIFRGIDDNADLLLERNGVIGKILAGDVFYESESK